MTISNYKTFYQKLHICQQKHLYLKVMRFVSSFATLMRGNEQFEENFNTAFPGSLFYNDIMCIISHHFGRIRLPFVKIFNGLPLPLSCG